MTATLATRTRSNPNDAPDPDAELNRNLVGQKLGRKGLETRERILASALRQIEGAQDTPVTLTSVAREASVGMTTLYLYFPDLGSLVLAALKRVMAGADAAVLDRLRVRWPDEGLEAACRGYVHAHFRFWREHGRILHMRNSLADADDVRFLDYRAEASRPVLELLIMQMDGAPEDADPRLPLAAVMLTGFERLAALVTNPRHQPAFSPAPPADGVALVDRMIDAQADLVALGVRHGRELGRCERGRPRATASGSAPI